MKKLLLFTSISFLLTSFISTYAQDVGEQNRPSLSIFYLNVNDVNADFSEYNFSESSLTSRSFIDVTGGISTTEFDYGSMDPSLISSPEFNIDSLAVVIKNYMESTSIGNEIIKHQFQVSDDFVWSNDLINERAVYSQTEREARSQLDTDLGALNLATTKIFDSVTRSYIMVVIPTTGQAIPSLGTLRGDNDVDVAFEANSILLKIDYENSDDVISALQGFYCTENCSNKEKEFNDYNVPLKIVDYAKGGIKTVSSGKSVDESNLLDNILSKSLDLVISTVPALQITTYVDDIKPVRAKIGSKEGVKVGRRYQIVRRILTEDNEIIEDNRGYVRAKEVSNNNENIVIINEDGEEIINEFEPSTFIQVHGIGISPRDVMVESVDFGLLVLPRLGFGSYTSFGGDLLYRIPSTVNTYGGITLDVAGAGEESTANFWSDNYDFVLNGTRTLLIQAGLMVSKDLYLLNGNFRLNPKISAIYNTAYFISDDAISNEFIEEYEPSLSTFGVKGGVDFAFQPRVNIGILAGLLYTYLPEAYESSIVGRDPVIQTDGYSDYFNNKGVQIYIGFRYGL